MSLSITPSDALSFTLSRGDNQTPRSIMKLENKSSNEYLVFKVKTTQPRRYLVRPNQGLIPPGKNEEVTIILVDKDKQILLNDYEQIGPEALESSKDKFLVISSIVEEGYYDETVAKNPKDVAECLTCLWAKISSNKNEDSSNTAKKAVINNKKLHVKHLVDVASLGTSSSKTSNNSMSSPSGNSGSGGGGYGAVNSEKDKIKEFALQSSPASNSSSQNPEQLFSEVVLLRKKYDELVAFSVNLTAERDILNNALEQAKRDLNREMAARMSAEDSIVRQPGSTSTTTNSKNSKDSTTVVKTGFSFIHLVVIAVICFFVGRYANEGVGIISERAGL